MTIQDLITRAQERWSERIKPSDVELISEERLHTPLTGEKLVKRCSVSELKR